MGSFSTPRSARARLFPKQRTQPVNNGSALQKKPLRADPSWCSGPHPPLLKAGDIPGGGTSPFREGPGGPASDSRAKHLPSKTRSLLTPCIQNQQLPFFFFFFPKSALRGREFGPSGPPRDALAKAGCLHKDFADAGFEMSPNISRPSPHRPGRGAPGWEDRLVFGTGPPGLCSHPVIISLMRTSGFFPGFR